MKCGNALNDVIIFPVHTWSRLLFCVCRPTNATFPDGYQFDGTGYASRLRPRYLPGTFDVIFEFKAFWKNALLFFVANDATVCR